MNMRKVEIKLHRIGGDIEEAGSAATAVEVAAAEKVFLSVAGDLRRRAGLDKVSRYTSPISFPYFLQTQQE